MDLKMLLQTSMKRWIIAGSLLGLLLCGIGYIIKLKGWLWFMMFGLTTLIIVLLVILSYFFYGSKQRYQLQAYWIQAYHHTAQWIAQKIWHMHARWFSTQPLSKEHPVYLLLGREGTGKTALLEALHLELSSLDMHQKLLGKEITCWLAKEAVCLDIPGYFLTTEQQGSWKQLLAGLNRMAYKRSLKGLILTLEAEQCKDLQATQTTLKIYRRYIHELYQKIGLKIPVYVLITKTDQLLGFDAFIKSMDSSEYQKPWGIAFNDQQSLTPQLQEAFASLQQTYITRVLGQSHLHEAWYDKLKAIHWLQEMREIHHTLAASLELFIEDTLFQEKICPQGLYWISVDQHTSYFLKDTFYQQIFESSSPVTLIAQHIQRQKRSTLIQMSSAILAFSVITGFLIHAYWMNVNLLFHGKQLVEQETHQVEKTNKERIQFLSLEAMDRHLYTLKHYKTHYPWYQRLGMNRVNTQIKLYEQIIAAAMEQSVYQSVKHRLISQLADFHEQWLQAEDSKRESLRGSYYSALKLYLMLHFPRQLELDFASHEMTRIWCQNDQTDDNSSDSFLYLKHLIRTYLEYLQTATQRTQNALTPKEALTITLARHDLRTASGIKNLYASIEYFYRTHLGTLSVNELFEGPAAEFWYTKKHMPLFYSRQGYLRNIKDTLTQSSRINPNHDWVIHAPLTQLAKKDGSSIIVYNDDRQQRQLLNQLNAAYFKEYLKVWMDFIASLDVVAFGSQEDAAQQLRILYGQNSPFVQLFTIIQKNTSLKQFLSAQTYEALPENVRIDFSEIEHFTRFEAGKSPVLTSYAKQMGVLQQEIERLSLGVELAESAEQYVNRLLNQADGSKTELNKSSMMVEQLINPLNRFSVRQAFKHVFLSPLQASYRAILQEALRGLEKDWKQQIFSAYQTHLVGYFPFDHQGADLNLAQFNAFFMPKTGIFAQFLQRISPFIQRENHQFVVKTWLGVGMPFSDSFLRICATIDQLSQSLYVHHDLSIHFAIYPIPTPGLKEILFSINGQSYPYRNGPQEWISFEWPTHEVIDNETFIRLTKTISNQQVIKEFQGTWGLFHLIYSAEKILKSPRGYRVEWQFKKGNELKKVAALLSVKTLADPFDSLLLHPLQLPKSIMNG